MNMIFVLGHGVVNMIFVRQHGVVNALMMLRRVYNHWNADVVVIAHSDFILLLVIGVQVDFAHMIRSDENLGI